MATNEIMSNHAPPGVETLAENRIIKIERVVANGQVTALGHFCEQPGFDFLVVLSGQVVLVFEASKREKVILNPGDFLVTKPGQSNRTDWTSRDEETVWIKVSFRGPIEEGSHPGPDLFGCKNEQRVKRLFANPPLVDSLVETRDVRLESVVARGVTSASSTNLAERENAWFLLLKGQAILRIAGERITMIPGDHVLVAPGVESSVVWTSPDSETIWIAAYFGGVVGDGNYPLRTGYTS